jgi:adenylate cyclase
LVLYKEISFFGKTGWERSKFMRPLRQFRVKLIAISLGLLGTLATSIGFYYGLYEQLGLESLTQDLRFRHFDRSLKDSRQVAVIAIDDGSLSSIGQWPWPRTCIAQMVNLLDKMNSREVLIDLVFSKPRANLASSYHDDDSFSEISEDESLARACKRQGETILSCYFNETPANRAIFDLLVSDLTLKPETISKKTNLPMETVEQFYSTTRKLAAMQRVMRELGNDPSLKKFDVAKNILGPYWLTKTEAMGEIEKAYDQAMAYQYLRYRAGTSGWMIANDGRWPSLMPLPWNTQMELPIASLSQNCADVGFVNFEPDVDGKVRSVHLLNYYDKMIFKQLAIAGICRHWQVMANQVKIYPNSISLEGTMGNAPQDESLLLQTGQTGRVDIPLTRDGKMILNWYAPHPDQWWKSVGTVIPASSLVKIAMNQESLAENLHLMENAVEITIKNLMPESYETYVKLQKQISMLEENIEAMPEELEDENADEETPEGEPAEQLEGEGENPLPKATSPSAPLTTMPTTTSAPATTIEEDLRSKIVEAKKQSEKIELDARQQLEWLYQERSSLTPEEQSRPENRLILDLWRCLNRPSEIQRINAELRETIERQLADITPLVRDRIVLIGYTGSTTADFVPTPVFNRAPGVMVHATILNQILQKAFLTESDRNSDLLVILIIGTLMSILSAQRSAVEGLIWMFVLLGGFVAFTCYVVFNTLHTVSAMVGPMAAILVSWSLVSFYRQITEGHAKRALAGKLGQYTSSSLVKRIVEDPDRITLSPEQVNVSCFFSDLAGFTPMSEKLGPEKTVQLLNIYFEHLSEILDDQEAFINKFVGDGIFAFFNPPLNPQKDHARRACLAAIEAQHTMAHIEDHLREAGITLDRKLETRIGISTGQAVVGDCGSTRKFDYTCLGDTVNLASRLESANKFFGTHVLISDQTRKAMGDDLLARHMGMVRLAGIEKPVVVHELIGYRDDHSERAAFVDLFETMVDHYAKKQLNVIPDILDRLEKIKPGDKSIKVYRNMLIQINNVGPEMYRDGVIDIETK